MISLQNETIQAVLFHERTGEAASEALKAFLQRILQRFGEVFKQELEQLQPQLQASATPTPEEVGVDTGTTWTRCFTALLSDTTFCGPVVCTLQREAVEAPFRRYEAELDSQLLLQSSGDLSIQ